jgi:replicative DNA helicase
MTTAQLSNGRRRSRDDARRSLPHSIVAEASILGGIILRNEVLAQLGSLFVDQFYDPRHRVVFSAIRNLEAARAPIDTVTLEDEIAKAGKLEAIGGPAFLGELVLHPPTTDNVLAYAQVVRGHYLLRELMLKASAIVENGYNFADDPDELLTETIADLQRLERGYREASSTVRLITVHYALDELSSLARAPVYPTPFPTLNEAIGFGGLLGTQVYTLAAGTGRGKTSWVAELAAHAAESGVPVLVVSYEMKPGYFVARRAAGQLQVPSNRILRAQVPMTDVVATMPYSRLRLMHRPTLGELRTGVEQLARMFGAPPLVIVDYLQKLADAIAARQQRPDLRLATTEASATLLDIAESTGAAIVAVSAIGRGKGRALSTPRKLKPYELVEVAKESGAVEYDGAGMIVLSLSDDFDGEWRIGTMTLAKARFGVEVHIDGRYHGAWGQWRDCGRVDPVDAIETPKEREPTNDELRQKIIDALRVKPARTTADIAERVKGNRQAKLAAIRELLRDGVVVKMDLGYTLSETGRQLAIEVTQ